MARQYKLDDQIGYLLRLANQRHAVIFQEAMNHDLTPTQFSALLRTAEHKEISQNQLGRSAAIDIATTKGVVDRLLDKRLVKRRSDPDDKRRYLISLTKAGASLVTELKKSGTRISADTLSPLNKTEQKTLLSLLKKIC